MRGVGIVAGLLAVLPVAATAQQANMAALSAGDVQVAAKVHLANKAEVDFGKLARENGSSKEVQEFGDRLVKDHGAAADKLRAMVEGRGGTLSEPSEQDLANDPDVKKALAKFDELKDLKGKDFDLAFTTYMVEEHEKDIKAVQGLAKQVSDSTLRATLNGMVPEMEQHLRVARDLSAKAGNPARKPNNHT